MRQIFVILLAMIIAVPTLGQKKKQLERIGTEKSADGNLYKDGNGKTYYWQDDEPNLTTQHNGLEYDLGTFGSDDLGNGISQGGPPLRILHRTLHGNLRITVS